MLEVKAMMLKGSRNVMEPRVSICVTHLGKHLPINIFIDKHQDSSISRTMRLNAHSRKANIDCVEEGEKLAVKELNSKQMLHEIRLNALYSGSEHFDTLKKPKEIESHQSMSSSSSIKNELARWRAFKIKSRKIIDATDTHLQQTLSQVYPMEVTTRRRLNHFLDSKAPRAHEGGSPAKKYLEAEHRHLSISTRTVHPVIASEAQKWKQRFLFNKDLRRAISADVIAKEAGVGMQWRGGVVETIADYKEVVGSIKAEAKMKKSYNKQRL